MNSSFITSRSDDFVNEKGALPFYELVRENAKILPYIIITDVFI